MLQSFSEEGWKNSAVEIDPAIIRIARDYFNLQAEDGEIFCQDGRQFLLQHPEKYDLILMDCQMPGLDGEEVTRIIREGREADVGQPVVVAITADVSEGHREKCLAAGMDDFLAKPIRLDTLTNGLTRWAGMSVSRRAQLAEGEAVSTDENFVDQLQERAGVANDAVINEFIDLFLDDTASRIEILHAALQQQDLKTVRRECHALKGACLELGVDQLGAFCDDLGRASREQRYEDLPLALDRLTAEFDRVRPLFEAGKTRPH